MRRPNLSLDLKTDQTCSSCDVNKEELKIVLKYNENKFLKLLVTTTTKPGVQINT